MRELKSKNFMGLFDSKFESRWFCPYCREMHTANENLAYNVKHYGRCTNDRCTKQFSQKFTVIFDKDACISCNKKVKCLGKPFAVAYDVDLTFEKLIPYIQGFPKTPFTEAVKNFSKMVKEGIDKNGKQNLQILWPGANNK